MQIKRFHAQNMTDALRKVKTEFGPEAVILSARSLKKEGGIFGQIRSGGVEITAAIDKREGAGGRAGAFGYRYGAYTRTPPDKESRSGRGLMRSLTGGVKVLQARRPAAAAAQAAAALPKGGPEALADLRRQLLGQKVDDALVEEIVEILGRTDPDLDFSSRAEALGPAARCLEQMGLRAAPRARGAAPTGTVVLLGATGVGKTTSAGKLAAAASMAGARCALISLDTHQAGANAKLGVYAKILNVPLAVVSNDEELRGALRRFKDRSLTVVDTPGICFGSDMRSRELLRRVEGIRGAVRHLVVSATAKAADIAYQLDRCRDNNIDGLVLTKLDETRFFGDLIAPLMRAGVPVCWMMNAPRVPEGMMPASVTRLVDLLLYPEHGRKNFPENFPSEPSSRKKGDARRRQDADPYVANRNSDTFHRQGCRWVRRIKEGNAVYLAGAEEALARSFKPCRSCCPEMQRTGSSPEAGEATALRRVAP